MPKTEAARGSERGSGAIILLPVLGLAASAVIYMIMRSRPAKLYGLVTDKDAGFGIEGVKITLNGHVAYTDADGYYELTGLKPKSYAITFEIAGYAPVYGAVTLVPDDNEVDVEMEALAAD